MSRNPGKQGIFVILSERSKDPDHKDDFQTLRSGLLEWSANDKLPPSSVIGYKLRSHRDQVVDGRCLQATGTSQRAIRWRVVDV